MDTDNPDAYRFHKRPKNTPGSTFKGYHIISDQVGEHEIGLVWRELEKVLHAGVPGDVVEFGCYAGTTSLFIRRLLDKQGQSAARAFHVYDSFEGLPPKTTPDLSPAGLEFTAGKLSVSKKEFIQEFRAAHLTPPVVHKGWFEQLTDTDVPQNIAFAYLDGDFYESILSSLKLVWPHLSQGGAVLVDDYNREALPGAAKAVQDYFKHLPKPRLHVVHDIAIITR
jgi:O-methyltransferase